MTDSVQSEERYPLLFLFLDDSNKPSRRNRNVFFERSRSQGIMSGATTVLTQWPGHLSSCGLAMVVIVMTGFFFFLMLIASTIKPVTNDLHPRCVRRGYDAFETNLYLVHDDDLWQQNELDALESILLKYEHCDIELLILRRENLTQNNTLEVKYKTQPPRPKRQTKHVRRRHVNNTKTEDKLDLNINIGATKLLKAFLERRRHLNVTLANNSNATTETPYIPNVDDILIKFPRVTVRNVTQSEFFENSPLQGAWKRFSKDILLFAARILKLWENGGISFTIPHPEESTNITGYYKYEPAKENETLANALAANDVSPREEYHLLKKMINVGYSTFSNLPEGLVTVDEQGMHMETKTTCHAFFGEALVQLKKHTRNSTTVAEVIKGTLKTFCKRGAVDSEYCTSVIYK